MLKEFIESISALALNGNRPQLVEADETKTYAIRLPDGKIDFVGNQAADRNHQASDLPTIAAFADKFKKASVWYSRSNVTLLTDDDERKDRVVTKLDFSVQAKRLIDLEKGKPLMSQRDFLFMLRTVFTASSFASASKLVEIISNVVFTAGQQAEGIIQRGRSSVGKAAQAEAKFSGGDVPHQVTLSVPLFDNAFLRKTYDVICAVEIYEQEQKFQIFPLPGEVESAFAAAEADLCQQILDLLGKSTATPVYFGVP